MQLAQLVLNIVPTDAAITVDQPFAYIVEVLNGITPTIIQARVAMGLSFDDQESLLEAVKSMVDPGVTSSTPFESDPPTSMPETGSFVYKESRDDNTYLQPANDVDIERS